MNRSLLGYPKRRAMNPALFGLPKRSRFLRFPVDEDRVSTSAATNTSHNVNLPAGCADGDLLIALLSTNSAGVSHSLAGFTELIAYAAGGSSGSSLWYRLCDGTEGATAVLTVGATRPLSAVVHRVSGGYAGKPIAIRATTNTDTPNIQPGRGAIPFLWITYLAHVIAGTSVPPAGWEKGISIGTNPSAAGASLQQVAESMNPPQMVSQSVNGRGYTVAIPPKGLPV